MRQYRKNKSEKQMKKSQAEQKRWEKERNRRSKKRKRKRKGKRKEKRSKEAQGRTKGGGSSEANTYLSKHWKKKEKSEHCSIRTTSRTRIKREKRESRRKKSWLRMRVGMKMEMGK